MKIMLDGLGGSGIIGTEHNENRRQAMNDTVRLISSSITIDGNPADFFDLVQALAVGADYKPDEFDRLLKLAELAKQGKAYAADSLFDITGIQFKATASA